MVRFWILNSYLISSQLKAASSLADNAAVDDQGLLARLHAQSTQVVPAPVSLAFAAGEFDGQLQVNSHVLAAGESGRKLRFW